MKDSLNFLKSSIRSINDYPKKGIIYRDITTLLKDPQAFSLTIDMCSQYVPEDVSIIAAIDARGFIIGSAIAQKLNKGFVPIRKKNKLPYKVISQKYDLEYGTDELELHIDSIDIGQKVVLVDDILATGGSANAAIKLINQLGADILSIIFLIELVGLGGRQILEKNNSSIHSIIKF
ncbi:MAG: adenine phosphoribosyltransferase [Hyphomicrobiales bacterium]|nr:adenine phosphoribosyltransferase [Hyphomicrobiales bacterium]